MLREGFSLLLLLDWCFSQDPPPKPQGSPNGAPGMPSDDQLYSQLSPGAFFGLEENQDEAGMGLGMSGMGPDIGLGVVPGRNGQKGYEHFDLSIIDAMSRQAQGTAVENSAHIQQITDKEQVETDELIIYNLCFCITYIWRRGRQSIRKYFHLRDIYANHLPFEVGYLTHVIMERYQNMLELYEYSAAQVLKPPTTASTSGKSKKTPPPTRPITRLQMSHFHNSIVKDSRTVVHLCNMMHELKNKYAAQPYNPANKFDVPLAKNESVDVNIASAQEQSEESRESNENKREGKEQPKIDKAYLEKRIKHSHKLIDEALAKRKKKLQEARAFYSKHGYLPTTTRTQQPMRLWSPNLDYGWSGEEDW